MIQSLLSDGERDALWAGRIVDVDVHVNIPSIEALFPYLDDVWIQHVRQQKWKGPTSAALYPPNAGVTARAEWKPDGARPPASELSLVQQQILDPWHVDHAILNCYVTIDGGPPDLSAALARAINDWLAAEWLERDPRLRASIVLPGPNDPGAMAAEIERLGGHPGFVQAFLPARSGKLYGKRLFWPVFEALVRHDLVGGIHYGGANDGLPPTPSGWPSWYVEEYAGEIQVFESQLINILAEGLFQKFPSLRLSFLESGFTWVPAWMWNLDRNWKGIRREVPWLDRRPFGLVREHVRFSTAPFDASSAEELSHVIRWLGSDDLLMFATDYPHWHDDDMSILLQAVPEEARSKLMYENARSWYKLGDGTISGLRDYDRG